MVTVEQHFNKFSLSLFKELSTEPGARGEYWFNAWKFYNQVKMVDVTKLNGKQFRWMSRIQDDLIREAGKN